MHVRVTGKARVALSRAKAESYKRAKEVLQERLVDGFEPSTKKELYKIRIQNRIKKLTESWSDFADELCVLADKAYPELQEKSREYIALNCYLEQLRDPRIAFEVRQRRPKTVSEAVTAALELESYLLGTPPVVSHDNIEVSGHPIQENSSEITEHIKTMLEVLMEKLEKLENKVKHEKLPRVRGAMNRNDNSTINNDLKK